jgi:hypothetical protein
MNHPLEGSHVPLGRHGNLFLLFAANDIKSYLIAKQVRRLHVLGFEIGDKTKYAEANYSDDVRPFLKRQRVFNTGDQCPGKACTLAGLETIRGKLYTH